MDTPIKILIGLPTMGELHISTAMHMVKWAKDYPRGMINFYSTYKVQPVDRARNQITKYFLDNPDFTHLFFIDSDTIPPVDALDKLLEHDLDIVSGLTPMLQIDKRTMRFGTFWNCFSKVTDSEGKFLRTECPKENTGLREVERCGGSCLLIKREVFDKLEKPYFKFVLDADGIDHVQSEDVYFCDTARGAGFKIMADTSVICKHQKSVQL